MFFVEMCEKLVMKIVNQLFMGESGFFRICRSGGYEMVLFAEWRGRKQNTHYPALGDTLDIDDICWCHVVIKDRYKQLFSLSLVECQIVIV